MTEAPRFGDQSIELPNAAFGQLTENTTFEQWYADWKAADPLRAGPDHPGLIAAMRTAWEAGLRVGLAINY